MYERLPMAMLNRIRHNKLTFSHAEGQDKNIVMTFGTFMFPKDAS